MHTSRRRPPRSARRSRGVERRLSPPRLLRLALLASVLVILGQAREAAADGTHLIAEAHIGVGAPLGADTNQVGPAGGVTLGFGGKLGGTLLRLYAIAQFSYSEFEILRETALGIAPLHRAVIDAAAGGRALVPLTPRLRVFADLMLGSAWLEREEQLSVTATRVGHDEQARLSLLTALGVQYRPLPYLSVGLEADFGVLLDTEGLEDVGETRGEISGRLNLLGTLTFHL